MRSWRPILRLLAALGLSAGCLGCLGLAHPRDISHEPRVRGLRLIGRCLVLKTDAELCEVGGLSSWLAILKPPRPEDPYRRLTIVGPSPPEWGRRIGTVAAGIRLHVVRVERATTYWDGLFCVDSDLVFGRIETGAYAGKIVDLGWGFLVLPTADRPPELYAGCPR